MKQLSLKKIGSKQKKLSHKMPWGQLFLGHAADVQIIVWIKYIKKTKYMYT